MGKQDKEKGISRIDSGSTHGWFVRGYKNGKTYSKLFSDKKSGGKEMALRMAREHRDSLMERLDSIPNRERKRRVVFRDARNKTGVLGVCRTAKKGPNGKMHECYSVSWRPEPGTQKCTSFSINKYGEEKAFKMAVEFRKQRMREIHGRGIYRTINRRSRETQTAN